MVESDHDMRNSADFISLDRVAKSLIRLPGVAMVQSITRPLGRPLEHATLPYLFTTQGSGSGQQLPFAEQQNANTDKQAQIEADSVTILSKVIDLTQKMSDELHETVLTMEDLQQVTDEMNSEIANLDDFLGPLKNYFYWEHTLFRHPACWAFRSLFDALDGIDSLDAHIANASHLPRGHRQAVAANDHAVEDHDRPDGGATRLFSSTLRPVASAVHTDRPDIRRP